MIFTREMHLKLFFTLKIHKKLFVHYKNLQEIIFTIEIN